ncbi:MAG: TetR/AcrR family transcriptional regulator [Gaiellaceae bacterium]
MAGEGRTLRLEYERPREVISRTQRERVIDAMIVTVSEKGYQHTSVSDVIRAAGVSRKTYYEHFGDKQECFVAAYDLIVGHLLDDAGEVYATETQWRHRIVAGLALILELLASRPDLARFCVIEILAAGDAALTRRDEVMRAFAQFLEPGREEVPDGVEISELTAPAVVGGIYSIVYEEIRQERAEKLARLCPDLVYIALAPYIGPEEAARETGRLAASGRSRGRTRRAP